MYIYIYIFFFFLFIITSCNNNNDDDHKNNNIKYYKINDKKNNKKRKNTSYNYTSSLNSSVSIYMDKDYEYLVHTSEKNNRIICVKKEYNDLIYYTHDNDCDPQNTFSFSFNSTFKFDEHFYMTYKKNKESFIEMNITPSLAIGSCINCLFLDEMNLLSIYGYTFIYNKSNEYEYKNYYKKIIDLYHNNNTEEYSNDSDVDKNTPVIVNMIKTDMDKIKKKKKNHNKKKKKQSLFDSYNYNKDHKNIDKYNKRIYRNSLGIAATTFGNIQNVLTKDKSIERNNIISNVESEPYNSYTNYHDIHFYYNNCQGNDNIQGNHKCDGNLSYQQDGSNSEENLPFYSYENSILKKFLKENSIHYAYDEIGKDKTVNPNISGNSDIYNNSSIKMVDRFFMNLKVMEDNKEDEKKEHNHNNHNHNNNNNNNNMYDHNNESEKRIFDELKNIIYKENECKIFKDDFNNNPKMWTNILFTNSFTNINILSHIDKYNGTYADLKYFSFQDTYKKKKLNDFLNITLDINNKEYLRNNNVYIIIANEEIKYINHLIFCSDIISIADPVITYIYNYDLRKSYEQIKNKYISEVQDNKVFLIKVFYYNQQILFFLIDYIVGMDDPMKLSIPFFYLVSQNYFTMYTHFFMKDNLIGWIRKSKILYVKTMNKIFSYIKESTHYTKKSYDVISIENKIISNIYLLYLTKNIFKYIIFARYNPLKNYSLHKDINFDSVLLNMISTFTNEELYDYTTYLKKITKKDMNKIKDKKKIKRMDIFEIFIIPSTNYIKFESILSKLFKALFDCGGKHISKLLKIAILRSHYDMLYNFNCYNFQLYSFLTNLLDLHEYFYEYADLSDLFKESQIILKQLIKLTLEEMNNLIPFNEDKYLIKYLIIILYFGNDMFCLDKENSVYIQLIHELRQLNIFHAIILAYLSGDKVGTLCTSIDINKEENNKIIYVKKNNVYKDIGSYKYDNVHYLTYDDDNSYVKYKCRGNCNKNDYAVSFIKKFDNKYFGDFHVTIRPSSEYTLGIILISFMASVVFIVGELHKSMKRIYVYRIFKNIFIKNYNHNITKYYTFWNSKLYAFEQYEPECVLLFNKYNLYEKYNLHKNKSILNSLKVSNNLNDLKEYKINLLDRNNQKDNINNNEELIKYFDMKKEKCLCNRNMINKSKGDFVVSQYLQIRYNFMNKIKKTNNKLYEKMLNYNFFNDPLDISYKTKKFQYEKLIDICKDMKFDKNSLCLFHKSRIILTYLYLLSPNPQFIFYVISPLVFIKPQKYCDEYDIPLVLNNMLKNRNFYKKNAQICINYAFAHFISSGDKTTNLVITAKISGTMVNISKHNLLLLLPLSKRVDILDYSKNNEYDIKEEILNEYFILGNPYTPINIIAYSFQEYDNIKKNPHITISGAFIKKYDEKYVTYNAITKIYDEKTQCTNNHSFQHKGKLLCFCDILSKHKNTNCLYPFCEKTKKFCYLNEECINGECLCIKGYSRHPMSSICEQNNECVLDPKNTCESPGKCVLAKNRYICLCPYPYVRILNNCLHPLKGIKIGLYIFNNFNNQFSNDEDDASKKERFYSNVFGSMSDYIKEAINDITKHDLKLRVHVKPIKKLKNAIKATVIINQRNNPNEPTPIEVFNIFLNQLSDSTSALNIGFFSYFARFTYIDYVESFSRNEHVIPFYQNYIKYIPIFLLKIFQGDSFNDISFIACVNFIILIGVTFLLLSYFIYLFVKLKFFQEQRVKAF
ncbi:conserved Plasmodium protein, unknown function [Plasmodium gaboni]|uniref:EGF-like domain-containing protein n=1 Tax=Plasmodium gaboni TaxID=647221 RepID=A0ABY1UMA8_9APIC|nr:conserved Plasmodium protein, unknown function [Plasmodium gaboni]